MKVSCMEMKAVRRAVEAKYFENVPIVNCFDGQANLTVL